MAFYSVQITLKAESGLAADDAINTWSCEAATDGDALLFTDEVVEFYDDLSTYFASTVQQNGNVYKIYDRSDPIPRVPVIEGLWNFTSNPSASPLPPEVAKCLSFQAVPQSGVPQARRRGRIYLGPLGQNTMSSTGRPSDAFVDAVVAAADTLVTTSKAATDWYWSVHSTTSGLDAEVDNGWVDDEFDTQRRRGRLATYRDTFS